MLTQYSQMVGAGCLGLRRRHAAGDFDSIFCDWIFGSILALMNRLMAINYPISSVRSLCAAVAVAWQGHFSPTKKTHPTRVIFRALKLLRKKRPGSIENIRKPLSNYTKELENDRIISTIEFNKSKLQIDEVPSKTIKAIET